MINYYRFSLLLLITCLLWVGCNAPLPPEDNSTLKATFDKANQYIQSEQLDSALFVLRGALNNCKTQDSLLLQKADIMQKIAVIYDIKGMYDSSSYYFYNALRIAEQKEADSLQFVILLNMGVLYFDSHKPDDAITFYEKALEIARRRADTNSIVKTLNNIGNAYATMKNDFEKAIPYFKQSIELAEKIYYDKAIRISKTTLIQIYAETGEIDKAYKLAIDIEKQYGWDPYTDFTLARIYRKKGEPDRAIDLYKQLLERKAEFDTRELHLAILDGLYQAYEEKKDYKNALLYILQGQNFKDSVHTLQTEKISEELEISYETQKKEQQITTLTKEKELYRWLGVSGGIIVLLLAALFIARQQIIKQKMTRLEQEKQLIAAQATLDGETTERTRLAKDLHDGLGGMLSAVKLNLHDMKQGVTIAGDDVERFNRALGMLDNSILELRRVAHHMMPDSLIRHGLKVSLSDFCNAIPSVQFHYFGNEQRLDSKLEILLYRSTHELVNNALKHADATQINVQLIQEEDRLSLTVQDNGKGFDTSANIEGMGLENIRNRVKTYNGKITLYSSPGNGTEINIEFEGLKAKQM